MIKEFSELYDYIRIIGEHIIRIQDQIGTIEKAIFEIKLAYTKYVAENRAELAGIHENMVTKSDLKNFIGQLKDDVREVLPSLPQSVGPTITHKVSQDITELKNSPEVTIEPLKTVEPPLRETQQKKEQKGETKKKTIFFSEMVKAKASQTLN